MNCNYKSPFKGLFNSYLIKILLVNYLQSDCLSLPDPDKYQALSAAFSEGTASLPLHQGSIHLLQSRLSYQSSQTWCSLNWSIFWLSFCFMFCCYINVVIMNDIAVKTENKGTFWTSKRLPDCFFSCYWLPCNKII